MKSNPLYHVLVAKEIYTHWELAHDIFLRVHLKRFNPEKWKKGGRTRIFALNEVLRVLGDPKIPLDPRFTAVDDPDLLDKVYTVGDAAEKWYLSPGHIRKHISLTLDPKTKTQKFLEGEFRKADSEWLLTTQGLNRIYGEPSERKEFIAAKSADNKQQ
jgi:hypothetical protein